MPKHFPAQALLAACTAGDVAAVSRLLPAGDPSSRLNLGGRRFQHPATKSTSIMVAALGGHIEIMRMLLARAPNTPVDDVDAMGFTAGAYTRPLLCSTGAVSDTRKYPTHPKQPLTPP
jgi:hypothetical protein